VAVASQQSNQIRIGYDEQRGSCTWPKRFRAEGQSRRLCVCASDLWATVRACVRRDDVRANACTRLRACVSRCMRGGRGTGMSASRRPVRQQRTGAQQKQRGRGAEGQNGEAEGTARGGRGEQHTRSAIRLLCAGVRRAPTEGSKPLLCSVLRLARGALPCTDASKQAHRNENKGGQTKGGIVGSAVVCDGLQLFACFVCRVWAAFQTRLRPEHQARLSAAHSACLSLLDCD
jgi:hypothetical protein